MSNSDIATAWRDAMLVDAFRRSRRATEDAASRNSDSGNSDSKPRETDEQVRERLEAARSEAGRVARAEIEQELAEVRARTNAEYERAIALRVKAARLRRELDAELKKARRSGRTESQKVIEDARRQASEVLAEARKSADQIRKTARQAAEAEVRALLADLESARSTGADATDPHASETPQAA